MLKKQLKKLHKRLLTGKNKQKQQRKRLLKRWLTLKRLKRKKKLNWKQDKKKIRESMMKPCKHRWRLIRKLKTHPDQRTRL